ncbi:L-ribulose-5-phosphate 3-epimerase [Anaerotalea alkaliphila]|uniref:L-ribulose-5-phosphate 3-epimerase n=1 Tax=Anaerotalea alkaliphila TaxID=2662126 RepID=A0A7X5HVR2_9FIRM|nr:L-ribulose-5-phosphate 3-epimerase [Anaerotalea alkaliphila]NDL67552.1 L-ribulose-5-phosphate 3-epimerase [Anaerotalea alkaliphila]
MFKLTDNPLGIYEKAIPEKFDWATKIKIAKEAGYDFLEMSIDESDQKLHRLDWSREKREYIKGLLADQEMYINSICLSGHRKYPFGSRDAKTRRKAYEIMDKAIVLAKDLGVRNIQLAGYDVYYEGSDEGTKAGFLEGLRHAVKKASSASVMLSIEIMDTEFIGTITRCMEYVRAVDSPWLQVYPDFGNLSQWTDEPERELEVGIGHIVGIHLKDTLPGKFKCVPFGEGTVDFGKLFSKLDALEYQGPFLVEMWADNTQDATVEESIDHIRSAGEWLKGKAGDRFNVFGKQA